MEDELLSRSRELRIVSQGEGAYAQEEESLIPSPKCALLKLSTIAQFRHFASIRCRLGAAAPLLLLIQKYYRSTTRSSNCSLAILALGGTDQCPRVNDDCGSSQSAHQESRLFRCGAELPLVFRQAFPRPVRAASLHAARHLRCRLLLRSSIARPNPFRDPSL